MPEQTLDLENKIIHETSVDFVTRKVMAKIYLMQYDDSLPVIKVNLLKNGQPYSLPDEDDVEVKVSLRYSLRNGPHEEQQGTIDDTDRSVVYFIVNGDMTYFDGPIYPIIKIKIDGQSAGSSYIDIFVNRNPVNNEELIPPTPIRLADVATSGNYNDLNHKPSIETYRHTWYTVSGTHIVGWTDLYYMCWDYISTSPIEPYLYEDAYPILLNGVGVYSDGSGCTPIVALLTTDGDIMFVRFDTGDPTELKPKSSINISHNSIQIT